MSSKKYDYLSLFIYIFFLLIGIGAAIYTKTFPQFNLSNDIGNESFPLIFSISLSILCLLGLLSEIFKKNQQNNITLSTKQLLKTFVAILLNVITVFLIDFIGFYLSSFIFSISIMLLLGIRNIYILVLFNIGLIGFIYFLFQELLNVPLPIGLIFER